MYRLRNNPHKRLYDRIAPRIVLPAEQGDVETRGESLGATRTPLTEHTLAHPTLRHRPPLTAPAPQDLARLDLFHGRDRQRRRVALGLDELRRPLRLEERLPLTPSLLAGVASPVKSAAARAHAQQISSKMVEAGGMRSTPMPLNMVWEYAMRGH